MSAPIRDRFGAIFRLEYYSDDDLSHIILQSATTLGISISSSAALEIALRSRGTPRIANRLLKRIRDYAQVHGNGSITEDSIRTMCKLLGVDESGLNTIDRLYLHTLVSMFDGGPVGIETISAAISEDMGSIEEVIEPYLIQRGYIKKTPRGRIATSKTIETYS